MPNEPDVEVVREGNVAVLFLRNPPENRITRSMLRRLNELLPRLEDTATVHAVVVAGAGGQHFSAGMDWKEWGALSPKDAQSEIQRGFEALWALEHLTKPSIAAIEGACHSVGAELALACDLRFASESASFRFPEVDHAWMPSHGGTARLPRIIGRSKALELLLTGVEVDLPAAFEFGIVHHRTARGESMAKALDLAQSIAAKPRVSVRAIKRALTEGEEKPYRNRFLLEAQHAVQLLWTAEYRQAMAALGERRSGDSTRSRETGKRN